MTSRSSDVERNAIASRQMAIVEPAFMGLKTVNRP
jgi:hypothetical protein